MNTCIDTFLSRQLNTNYKNNIFSGKLEHYNIFFFDNL